MNVTATKTRRSTRTRKTAEPTVAVEPERSGKYIDPEQIDWDASFATQEPNASAKAAESEATPSPEPEATPKAVPPAKGKQPYTLTVPLSETEVPRHFWPSLGADGGAAIAKAHGVDVAVDNKAEALILTSPKKADLEKAHRAIVKMWTDALAASKVWKLRPEYKAASTQDRWKALTAYLRAYAQVTS